MEITKEKRGNVVLLEVKGRLDTSTSKTLEETLFACIDEGEKQFALGCSQLDYISSAGLRVLLLAAKRLKNVNGKIVLYALKAHVKEVFDAAGFSSIFPSFNTQEEALRSFDQ
jgi:anti-sigma B factor antagonist